MDNKKIMRCGLYTGEPQLATKDGKYHVVQGIFTAEKVKKWYDSENEAVESWNARVKALKHDD